MNLKNKRGQLTLADAPTVVLLVGLVFLIMATMAFIGAKYGDVLVDDQTSTFVNETITSVTTTGKDLTAASFTQSTCTISTVINASTGTVINAGNFTQTNCRLASSGTNAFNNTNWNVTYTATFKQSTTASNVTVDLNTEIANNTSIAGIVLTISLVGIVLSVLIGIFIVTRRGTRA